MRLFRTKPCKYEHWIVCDIVCCGYESLAKHTLKVFFFCFKRIYRIQINMMMNEMKFLSANKVCQILYVYIWMQFVIWFASILCYLGTWKILKNHSNENYLLPMLLCRKIFKMNSECIFMFRWNNDSDRMRYYII